MMKIMVWPLIKTVITSISLWLTTAAPGPASYFTAPPLPPQPQVMAAMISPELTPTPPNYLPLPHTTAHAFWVESLPDHTALAQHHAYQPLPPASTTKIMTALVTLDTYALDEVIEVTDVTTPGANMGLIVGEQLKVRDLLYGLLLHSGNDAAIVLASHFPNGQAAFVDAMNQKAQQLHLEQTHYMNPTGLHDPLHLSSTRDLVILTQAALQYPEFTQIIGTYETTVTSIDGSHQRHLINRNTLLKTVPGVKGVKTGWTEEAGEALVTWIEREGKEVLIAVLGSENRFEDTKALIDWSFENF